MMGRHHSKRGEHPKGFESVRQACWRSSRRIKDKDKEAGGHHLRGARPASSIRDQRKMKGSAKSAEDLGHEDLADHCDRVD